MAKFRLESKYAHPDKYFFLRCGEDADFLSPDDLNSYEKLVKDILNFIRRKFSYQEYRMFTLRFYESDFSFKALGECMGISVHIPADTRSAFPVISVHSPVSIQCRWQS